MSGMAPEIFDLTAEQREIRDVCREFAAAEIRPISLEVDEADTEMPWEVWYKAAGLGLTSFMLPEEYGGAGLATASRAASCRRSSASAAPGSETSSRREASSRSRSSCSAEEQRRR